MKIQIQPIQTWPKPSVFVNIFIAADDLSTCAAINYILLAEDGTANGSGQFQVNGDAYLSWRGTNEEAIAMVLAHLNLTQVVPEPQVEVDTVSSPETLTQDEEPSS